MFISPRLNVYFTSFCLFIDINMFMNPYTVVSCDDAKLKKREKLTIISCYLIYLKKIRNTVANV